MKRARSQVTRALRWTNAKRVVSLVNRGVWLVSGLRSGFRSRVQHGGRAAKRSDFDYRAVKLEGKGRG